jgi:hypothetical protein
MIEHPVAFSLKEFFAGGCLLHAAQLAQINMLKGNAPALRDDLDGGFEAGDLPEVRAENLVLLDDLLQSLLELFYSQRAFYQDGKLRTISGVFVSKSP